MREEIQQGARKPVWFLLTKNKMTISDHCFTCYAFIIKLAPSHHKGNCEGTQKFDLALPMKKTDDHTYWIIVLLARHLSLSWVSHRRGNAAESQKVETFGSRRQELDFQSWPLFHSPNKVNGCIFS